ncbi:hypothetical protein [Lysobacter sp. D1-1-M9]|uniref:hypothetical protein n=1 Tax=Novilysobacter longmucuonensis TaxID=3098603 RepID=UPI002FC8084C
MAAVLEDASSMQARHGLPLALSLVNAGQRSADAKADKALALNATPGGRLSSRR